MGVPLIEYSTARRSILYQFSHKPKIRWKIVTSPSEAQLRSMRRSLEEFIIQLSSITFLAAEKNMRRSEEEFELLSSGVCFFSPGQLKNFLKEETYRLWKIPGVEIKTKCYP